MGGVNMFGEIIENQKYIEREGVYGIFDNDKGEVGVVKVRDAHLLVGGGIEAGENHITALKREFIEEIGYDIEILEFIDRLTEYHCTVNGGQYYKLIGNIYRVKLNKKIHDGVEPDHQLKWLKYDDVNKGMILSYQSYILQHVFAQ